MCANTDEGVKGNTMTKKEFLEKIAEDEEYSPGWQAIDNAFEKLYPGQKPAHDIVNIG